MNLRKLLIRVMLWSLALGAIVGATSVLFASTKSVWRIVGTFAVTAVGALAMLGAAVISEKRNGRSAGMLGMLLVLVEYFGALLLIWEIPYSILSGGHSAEQLAITMLLIAPIGIAAMTLLRTLHQPQLRLAGWVGVLCCAIELILVLCAIWMPRSWSDEKVYGTAAAFALFAALGILSLIGHDMRSPWHPLWRTAVRGLGVLAASVGFVVTLVAIWNHIHNDSGAYCMLVTAAAYLAYLNTVLSLPLQPRHEWLRIATLVAAALTAACIDIAVIEPRGFSVDWPERAGAAAGILAGCGTLALAILLRINPRMDLGAQGFTELKSISIICPFCRKKQTMDLGDSHCAACGLILHIRAEAPRCASCGYLMLMNKSPRCPECGTAVSTVAAMMGTS